MCDPGRSSDPAMSQPSYLLGNKTAIKGMTKAVQQVQGCGPVQGGSGGTNMYCWTINWVPFAYAKDDTPLLFPDAKPGPQVGTLPRGSGAPH